MDYLGEITEQGLIMQRGDSRSLTLALVNGGTPVTLTQGTDVVIFTAKLSKTQTTADITKTISTFTDGKAVIYLEPDDTDDLDVATYQYDIQWNHNSDKYTVLKGKLKIEEDVTRD